MANFYRVAEEGSCCQHEDSGLTLELLSVGRNLRVVEERLAGSHLGELASTIESSIIPRLLLSHGLDRKMNDLSPIGGLDISSVMVEDFSKLLIGSDNLVVTEYVEGVLSRGVPLERVMLDLLAPAARLMGEFWEADLCSFMDVTLGLARVQQVLRHCRSMLDDGEAAAAGKGRVLLVPAPGEQHTFGLRVVEELMLRDGWEVSASVRASEAETAELVSAESYDIVGFSVSGDRLLPGLRSAIARVRAVSRNQDVRIFVGGSMFMDRPKSAGDLGADAVISDVALAVALANEWYASSPAN